jgi:hypothetical protein
MTACRSPYRRIRRPKTARPERRWILDAWTRAGITRGSNLVDFGAGPGYATCEYQDYSTWRVIPASRRLDSFVREVMSSWRASGGEPNIAASLLPQMAGVGLRLVEVRPLIFSIRPAHFAWRWPASFVHGNSRRLVELGRIPREDADALRSEFQALEQNPDAVMITPLVLEIIAEKASTSPVHLRESSPPM